MLKNICWVLLAPAAWPLCLAGQTPAAAPAYQELRWDEDWTYLRDGTYLQNRTLGSDFWDPVKYIPLNDHGWFLSIGGGKRPRYRILPQRDAGSGAARPARPRRLRRTGHRRSEYVQQRAGLELG